MAVAFVRSHTVTSEKTSDASVNLAISTVTGIGNVLVAYILFDNAATTLKPEVSSIAKAAGESNSWARLGASRSTSTSAGGAASGEMWAIYTTVAWPVASYAVTLDSAVTMKATMAQEFSGALATLRSTVGTGYSTGSTAATATTTGTTPVTGDLAILYIYCANTTGTAAGDTDTTGGSWSTPVAFGSSGGGGTTNNTGGTQYKILTSGVHQTGNNSTTLLAGNGAVVAILQSNPTTPPTPSFTASAGTVVVGSTLTFTDTSTGTPTSWLWNFGTGASPATASTQGPHVVTYSTVGTSNVNLTAINAGGGAAATPTAITVTRAAVATLVDSFDSAINNPPWTVTGPVVWSAGQARFGMDVSDVTGVMTTGYNYTLVGSSVYAKITPPAFVNNSSIIFRVQDAAGDVALMELVDNGLVWELQVHIENTVAGDTDVTVGDYSSQYLWFRARAVGTTLYLETAPDGATWTVRTSGTCDADMSAVRVYFEVDKGDGQAGAYTYIDNVNVPDSAPPPTALTRNIRLGNAAIRRSSSR